MPNFNFEVLPPSISSIALSSNNLANFQGCQALKHLTNLTFLDLSYNPLGRLYGECLPDSLLSFRVNTINLENISQESCEALSKLPFLYSIELMANILNTFNISCLPLSVEYVYLNQNKITTLTSTESLKNLTHLWRLYLHTNHLQTFNLGDLPTQRLLTLEIYRNEIFNLTFQTPDFEHIVELDARFNSINCDCNFLADYKQMLESGRVNLKCDGGSCITCHPDSELVDFPWTNQIEDLVDYEYNNNRCVKDEQYDPIKVVHKLKRLFWKFLYLGSSF